MTITYNTNIAANQFAAFGSKRELLRNLHPCPIGYNNDKLIRSHASAVEDENGNWTITTILTINEDGLDIDLR
jgi:hypothetical protein